MELNEAKQFLLENGYDVINEAGLGWDEGYEQLNPTEQKAADWLIQHNENIDEVHIIEAISDHKEAWLKFMSAENMAEMVQAYLNSLTPEEIEDL
jgi:hypothetical protein